ncbi:MAG: hypothetical protein HQ593_01745 [Candidatus Omnitrophica bacterium]|nr:hypothetical protein [Candidatus Omnitrophota bacterium]
MKKIYGLFVAILVFGVLIVGFQERAFGAKTVSVNVSFTISAVAADPVDSAVLNAEDPSLTKSLYAMRAGTGFERLVYFEELDSDDSAYRYTFVQVL